MQEQLRTYLSALRSGRLPFHRRQITPGQRKLISIVLTFAVVASAALGAAMPLTTSASETNVLTNGSFEHGFVNVPGCGVVGAGWNCFTNGGAANFGFYDDQWELVVADGVHSQLIEINGKGLMAPDHDRYAGISQTVRVNPNAAYTFSMRGMIRTTNHDGDPWRYRVEVGWAPWPNADWRDVHNWTDAGINTYFDRLEPGYFTEFRTTLAPQSEVVTIFVRVWRKWGIPNEEIDVNLDAIALVGPPAGMPGKPSPREMLDFRQPEPVAPMQPIQPVQSAPQIQQQQPSEPQWSAGPAQTQPCSGANLVFNGDFESGFNSTGLGAIGRGWGGFTNGGAANFGFYNEQWDAVVSWANRDSWSRDCEGNPVGNGQLIEINSKNMFPTDPDRFAGIFQRIGGLTPGATYRLTVRGLLRGEGNEEDPYRFEAQWGMNPGIDTDWRNVRHWEGMDLGPIYKRTEPGPLGTFTTEFKAPDSSIVLFIRGWKKWAVTNVEMDFNLDDISIVACCGSGGGNVIPWPLPQPGPQPQPDPQPPPYPQPDKGGQCVHVIQPGDTLGGIARQYGVSVDELVNANGLFNPNIIVTGLTLSIPGCSGGAPSGNVQPAPTGPPQPRVAEGQDYRNQMSYGPAAATQTGPMSDDGNQARTHVVQPGDSLGLIAQHYGIDAYALVSANGIQNADIVVVGQTLRIP